VRRKKLIITTPHLSFYWSPYEVAQISETPFSVAFNMSAFHAGLLCEVDGPDA
jgi:hypothetical protein